MADDEKTAKKHQNNAKKHQNNLSTTSEYMLNIIHNILYLIYYI